MGNFYTNITVIGGSASRIAAELRELRREAYIADLGETCVVYDRQCDDQDTEILSALAEHLATRLGAKSFAVLNHDDDILWFQLYEGSQLVSEYANSGGPVIHVRALCRAFGKNSAVFQAWFLLHRPFLFQVNRHSRLTRLLGLPEASVGCGFKYISHGEAPVGVEKDKLLHIR